MIVNTVHQIKSSHDKVDKIDVWLLNQIVTDECYTNVSFVLANMFCDARGYREKIGLMPGQYIIRLAREHGILSERVINSLTRVSEMVYIEENQLKWMKAMTRVVHMGVVNFVWNRGFEEVPVEDEEVPVEEEEVQSQHQPSGGGASSSHHAPPEWDSNSVFQGLQYEFHQFSLGQTDTNHRMDYL